MSELTETERRKARAIAQRTGIVPGPNSPLLQVSGRTVRSEDAEEQLCDDLIASIAGPSGVVRLSQRRASNITRGVSDRRYRVYGEAFFFEVKAEDGKLTRTQHEFLLAELAAGALAACGTLEDLQLLLAALASTREQPYLPRSITRQTTCAGIINRWVQKGYRHESTPRARRGRR